MDKIRFQTILRRVVAVPIGIAAMLALAMILGVQALVNREGWVDHTDQVIATADHLFRTRIDEETGLRAYLLTHDERFLQPSYAGRDEGRKLEDRLRQLISDNPEQQARNQDAMRAYQKWSSFADETIAMAKVGHDVADLKLQLRGKELMDRYRGARTEFVVQEEKLRDERVARSQKTLALVNLSIVGLCFLGGAIFAAFARKQLTVLSTIFGAALDLADTKAKELQAQKEWLNTTLQSIGDAVIATDAEGSVSFMNPIAEKLTGWTTEEAKNRGLADVFRIINEHTRETAENPIDKVRRMNQVVGLANHTVLISKTGQEFAIDDSGAPIRDTEGKIVGIVLVFRDITQQRGLENALRSNERLAVAGRLSASIAHEIHNPLDTVGNLLFMAAKETRDLPQVQQLITTAQREVYRVTQISKNMLSLHRESRIPSRVKIAELLEGVMALIEETLVKGRRKIRIENGFDGEIEGFPAELRQVFTNVIKNAVEATSEGGSIRILSVPTQDAGRDGVLIDVTDNGVGIPESMKSKLFTPFASSKQEGGSGLGLWVSRSIVEKHEGSIRVSSPESGYSGTTVSVFLPRQTALLPSAEKAASKSTENPS